MQLITEYRHSIRNRKKFGSSGFPAPLLEVGCDYGWLGAAQDLRVGTRGSVPAPGTPLPSLSSNPETSVVERRSGSSSYGFRPFGASDF
jgi:hypothetical protein